MSLSLRRLGHTGTPRRIDIRDSLTIFIGGDCGLEADDGQMIDEMKNGMKNDFREDGTLRHSPYFDPSTMSLEKFINTRPPTSIMSFANFINTVFW